MSERRVTLFEYHSHGAGPQFFPNAFAGEEPTAERAPAEEAAADDDGDDGGGGLALLAFLILLLGVAVAIRYLRDGDGVPSFEPRQVEVTEFED